MPSADGEASRDVVDDYNHALDADWENHASTFKRILNLAFEDAGIDTAEISEAIDAVLRSAHHGGFMAGTAFGLQQGTAFAARLTMPSRQRSGL